MNLEPIENIMKLWVDDIRPAPSSWFHAKNAKEAITLLETNCVSDLSLDHDLGKAEAKTGYDIMLWIEERVHTRPGFKLPEIKFHTSNPPGRKNMTAALKSIKKYLKKR